MTSTIVEQTNFVLEKTGSNLTENHIVFSIKKLIDEFWGKTRHLFENQQTKQGRPKTYAPQELLGFTLLCTSNEIRTCRKMEKAIKNNDESINYILNNKKPSKSTIAKFKNDNELIIMEFFYFTVYTGQILNLIDNNIILMDGTFLKANASTNNNISDKQIKRLERTLKKLDFTNKKNTRQKELKKYYINEIKTEKYTNTHKNN